MNGNLVGMLRISLNRVALLATLHCLTGCAAGEVLGIIIGTALEWEPLPTIALAVGLAFFFGYFFTLYPLMRAGLGFKGSARTAFVADTASITTMEITDNAVILAVPGAMDAGLGSFLFWVTLAFALFVAFWLAYPLNRWMISRGKGHAVVHEHRH